jgi:putative IMPACT (imprinted ancient) family translation regulator
MTEQFDYLNSNLSLPFNEKIAVRNAEMFEREVRERAKLMCHLKYSQADTVSRLKQNIAWEFDDAWTRKSPSVSDRIDELVALVYKHLEGKKD